MTSTPDPFPGQTIDFGADVRAPVPSGGEFTTVWVAYGCFFFGVILWWPSIIGLIISYVRRDEPGAGFIASHYRWLIRTFWWSSLAWLLSIGLIVGGVLPIVRDVLRSAKLSGQRLGDIDVDTLISIDWSSIFAAAGMATLGGIALLCVYAWLLYRLIRGALRLTAARPAP
ncbi:MAG: hypothetical protein U5L03_13945 [Burkholderiaceae bacterium]|nr:hypothetical protein [Burkholderiaceae bacterium]